MSYETNELLWKQSQNYLKNVNDCWYTNMTFCSETSVGQHSDFYVNVDFIYLSEN